MARRLGVVGVLWAGAVLVVSGMPLQRKFSEYIVVALILAIAAIGYDLLVGAAGQLSLANAALIGCGAYVSGILSANHDWPVWLGVVAAVLTGGVVAGAIGAVSLHLRSFYFAVVTLSFAVLFNVAMRVWYDVTGGSTGLSGIPGLGGGTIIDVDYSFWIRVTGFSCGAVLLIAMALLRSKVGSAWRVIATDEVLAESLGIRPFAYKTLAFALSGAFAGLAGALHAHYQRFIAPDDFAPHLLVELLLVVFVGGAGTAWGAVVGAFAIEGLGFIDASPEASQLITVGVLIFVLVVAPKGIAALVLKGLAPVRRRLTRTRAVEPPTRPVLAGTAHAQSDGAVAVECRGVSKSFGAVKVLEDVDFTAKSGRIHGLIGPNGAGKTTLINIFTQYLASDGGEVVIDGEPVRRCSPLGAVRRGVRRTFQTPRLVESLTVRENVLLGSMFTSGRNEAEADELMGALGLAAFADAPAATLPAGARRVVEIARALAGHPKVLLLDEPLAGLVPTEIGPVAAAIRHARDAMGVVVVLVEHNLGVVFDISDDVSVLDTGRVMGSGPAAEVAASPSLRTIFGAPETVAYTRPNGKHPLADAPVPSIALEARNVVAGYGSVEVLHGFDMAVMESSVSALIGVNGAGKTTALCMMSGLLPVRRGSVVIGGVEQRRLDARKAVRLGVAHVPQGRHVFPTLTVRENLLTAARAAGLPRSDDHVDEVLERLPLLRDHLDREAGALSGGQQQVLVIGRALITKPKVLLIDEPSMGLALRLLPSIGELIDGLRRDGLAIVLAEQNVAFARDVAQRVYLVDQGRVATSGDAHLADDLWSVVMENPGGGRPGLDALAGT
jgi:branched-chain amino acid transport system ATP-binding protein